jgi:hypothetical protein
MENQPKNQNYELEAGLGILQDSYSPPQATGLPPKGDASRLLAGVFLYVLCILFLIGCGNGGGESSTGTLYAEITELEVLYGVTSDTGPGYWIGVVFENTGDFDIENAYWHIYGEPYTWTIDNPRLYISVNSSIMTTTEIFKDSFYGRRYFTISLYDQNDHMLATRTVISGYI